MFKGDKISMMLFGTSHGKCVGVCVEGLPYGLKIDEDKVREYSEKRKGVDALSTARREADEVEIVSGVANGVTTGGTLCAVIANKDTKPTDYSANIPRPSHSDYVAFGRYGGYNDYRGGGGFSGRLTAPLVFVGAVCDSILEEKGVTTGVHTLSVHNVCDKPLDMANVTKEDLINLNGKTIPVFDERVAEDMEKAVISAREQGDSVGGIIECAAVGYPPFIGGSYFDRLNSKIGALVFSVPAFSGLEFGSGFAGAKTFGSQNNDPLRVVNGKIVTETNNSGGINGGVSNGMPIVIRCSVKPTPSVYKTQRTVDMEKMTNIDHNIKGRHDPCIALRGGIVLRSVMNIALADGLI